MIIVTTVVLVVLVVVVVRVKHANIIALTFIIIMFFLVAVTYCNSWLSLTAVSPPGVTDRTVYIPGVV